MEYNKIDQLLKETNVVDYKKIDDDICLFLNGTIISRENVFAEDYAFAIIKNRETTLKNYILNKGLSFIKIS